MSERPVLIAVTGDIHSGSTIALMPPEFVRDDGEIISQSRVQRWLWEKWIDYWGWIEEQKELYGAELWWICPGDLNEGLHHGSTQTGILHKSDEIECAMKVLEPMTDLRPSRKFMVRGTPAHVGKGSWREEQIGKRLHCERDPATPQRATWYHLRLECRGVNIDVAHHGKRGHTFWTEANAVQRIAAEIEARHSRLKWKPDLALRAHVHIYKDSYNNFPVRAITLPAWQLKTEWIEKIAPDSLSDIGGAAVLCEAGEYWFKVRQYPVEEGSVWTEQIEVQAQGN